ncbi:hypothetical protein FBUS_04139 [Fasciolopsis buskii]|uniref:Meckel syndrome type 1 protein n=1 Tax=Fasciolopsis buskii TaxID=27845 RepID=A0A8E0S2W7_9TREM|nr:hypothetical protein FBUS_04139 [Fasciolopsis buski]
MQNASKIGNYVVVDPVRNFRIGVKLGRIITDLSNDGSPVVYDEEVVIRWQQKLFSPRERAFYSNASNCVTETHHIYHKEISSTKVDKPRKTRIFTYTEQDEFSSQIIAPVNRGISSCSFPLRKLQEVNLQLMPERLIKNTTQSGFSLVIEKPSSVQILVSHLPVKLGRAMYVMADLSDDIQECADIDDGTKPFKPSDEEVMLCVLTLGTHNVLSVFPDFSQMSVPYKISSPKSHNLFQYELTHMSPQMPSVEQEKENKLMKEIVIRENARMSTLIGNEFEMVCSLAFPIENIPHYLARTANFSPLCNGRNRTFLNSLKNKLIQRLCIKWMGNTQNTLSTFVCIFRFYFQEQISNFSHPLEFDLAYRAEINLDSRQPNAFKWPILFFEVSSLDFWTRTRTEGYGYLELPRTAGEHVLEVQCWRPVGESIIDELRRYFVGGTCQLEDMTYTGIPGTLEDKHLVKYGFRTQTTGVVKFRLNCAVQSWASLHKHVTKNAIRATDVEKKIALSHLNVASVIRKFLMTLTISPLFRCLSKCTESAVRNTTNCGKVQKDSSGLIWTERDLVTPTH